MALKTLNTDAIVFDRLPTTCGERRLAHSKPPKAVQRMRPLIKAGSYERLEAERSAPKRRQSVFGLFGL